MPNINLDDAYILGETGAQVDKVTGLFTKDEDTTSGEKAFAQLNIGTAGSNRNLLDNPWFTVNQRSATTVTLNGTEAYIADRWIAGSFGTYTHNSDNTITITCPNSTSFAGLTQRIDPIYKGGTYTFSIRLNDDTVISLQGTMPSGSGLNIYNININGTAWQVLFRSDGSAYWVTLRCNVANTTLTVKAAKLELGSISTIANDAPPDYGEELAKCMRYFQRVNVSATMSVGFGTMTSGTEARVTIPLSVPLRSAPTVSVGEIGSFRIVSETQAKTPSSFTYLAYSPVGVAIKFVVSSGIAELNNVSVQINSTSAYIDLSADL